MARRGTRWLSLAALVLLAVAALAAAQHEGHAHGGSASEEEILAAAEEHLQEAEEALHSEGAAAAGSEEAHAEHDHAEEEVAAGEAELAQARAAAIEKAREEACAAEPLEDYNLGLHIGAVFILLGVSLLGSFLPVLMSFIRSKLVIVLVRFGMFFGFGTILATAFIHMLLAANENLSSPCLTGTWENYEAWAFMFCVAAIVGMQLVDYLIEIACTHLAARSSANKNKKKRHDPECEEAGKGGQAVRGMAAAATRGAGAGAGLASSPSATQGFLTKAHDIGGDPTSDGGCATGACGCTPLAPNAADADLEAGRGAATKVRAAGGGSSSDDDDYHGDIEQGTRGGGGGKIGLTPTKSQQRYVRDVAKDDLDLTGHHFLTDIAGPGSAAKAKGGQRDWSQQAGFYMVEAGIVFHSVLIGLTLGVTAGSAFTTLLIALSFHQFFEGLAIGAAALGAGLSRPKAFAVGLVYALTTPTGIAIGIGVREAWNGNGTASLVTQGILDSVSAGILIYVVLVELMTPMMTKSVWLRRQRWWVQALGIACFWCGAGVMSVIGTWA